MTTCCRPTRHAAHGSERADHELRARGLELSFNLDHAEALAVFREAIAADPASLAGYRLLATVLWSSDLDRAGLPSARKTSWVNRLQPFRARQSNAALEHARRRSPATDRRAGGTATWRLAGRMSTPSIKSAPPTDSCRVMAGTIDGSQWRSIGAARRAYQEHQRVLALDPSRKDAALTVGMYRFLVSRLPAWSRLAARVAGFDSDRGEWCSASSKTPRPTTDRPRPTRCSRSSPSTTNSGVMKMR